MPYSSCMMPRLHTGAVNWYSGEAVRLPATSLGSRMPLAVETNMHECRNEREGYTGIATKGLGSRASVTQYEDNDNSATSNSR